MKINVHTQTRAAPPTTKEGRNEGRKDNTQLKCIEVKGDFV
jgi:hypothetical protein